MAHPYKEETASSARSKLKAYADGGTVEKVSRAREELADRLTRREEVMENETLPERDRREANEGAWARGDYTPNEYGGYEYKPHTLRREGE